MVYFIIVILYFLGFHVCFNMYANIYIKKLESQEIFDEPRQKINIVIYSLLWFITIPISLIIGVILFLVTEYNGD